MNQNPSAINASSALMQLWQSAMPIQKARFQLAERHLVDKLKELSQTSFTSEWSKNAGIGRLTNMEVMKSMEEALKTSNLAAAERRKIERQIDQSFADMIIARELRCFAFEPPRGMSSEPVEMQVHHWTTYPNWESGEFKANGLHLIELRVLRTELAIEESKLIAPAKTGRPGYRQDIVDAYVSLKKDGKLPDGPMTTWFPLINMWIRTQRPNSKAAQSQKGVGDQAIRNAIRWYEEGESRTVNKL